jgi:Domain of unknown function (DUF4282)
VNATESLLDFLRFRAFISPHALIVFYYLGALGMPGASWLLLVWLRRRYKPLALAYDTARQTPTVIIPLRYRVLTTVLFLSTLLFMELMWRMLFEYLIAFLQMRDALLLIRDSGGAQ